MVNYISKNRKEIINGLYFSLKIIYATVVICIGFILGLLFIVLNYKKV